MGTGLQAFFQRLAGREFYDLARRNLNFLASAGIVPLTRGFWGKRKGKAYMPLLFDARAR